MILISREQEAKSQRDRCGLALLLSSLLVTWFGITLMRAKGKRSSARQDKACGASRFETSHSGSNRTDEISLISGLFPPQVFLLLSPPTKLSSPSPRMLEDITNAQCDFRHVSWPAVRICCLACSLLANN